MSLTEDLAQNLAGYSKAKFSTWLFYRPDRFLLDAGEGVATSLGNYIYAVEQIFVSHGHFDHIGGIPGILRSRLSSRGDKEKPIDIYYPEGNRAVAQLREYIEASIELRSFEVRWHGLQEGAVVPLRTGGSKRAILSLATRHIRGELTLGYTLLENRRRLQACYADLPEEQVRRLVTLEGAEVMEPYQQRLLTYSGDAMPLEPSQVEQAQLLVHDATFLRRKDRERETHATLEEAMRLAAEGDCGGLVAFHLSSRYSTGEVRRGIQRLRERLGLELPVWFLEFKSGLRRDLLGGAPGELGATAAG